MSTDVPDSQNQPNDEQELEALLAAYEQEPTDEKPALDSPQPDLLNEVDGLIESMEGNLDQAAESLPTPPDEAPSPSPGDQDITSLPGGTNAAVGPPQAEDLPTDEEDALVLEEEFPDLEIQDNDAIPSEPVPETSFQPELQGAANGEAASDQLFLDTDDILLAAGDAPATIPETELPSDVLDSLSNSEEEPETGQPEAAFSSRDFPDNGDLESFLDGTRDETGDIETTLPESGAPMEDSDLALSGTELEADIDLDRFDPSFSAQDELYTSPVDKENAHGAASEEDDGSELDMGGEWDGGESLPDPEPLVTHYHKGKIVRKRKQRRWLVLVPLILVLGGAGFLFRYQLAHLLDQVGRWLAPPPQTTTALQQQLERGRKVVIETIDLQHFAPQLRPGQVRPGTDLDLLDKGRPVDPARYRVHSTLGDLQLILAVDVRTRNPVALQAYRKYVTGLVASLQEMPLTIQGQRIKKRFRLYGYRGHAPRLLAGDRNRLTQLAAGAVLPVNPYRVRKPLLPYLLQHLARGGPGNFQVLYLSDYDAGQCPAFASEPVFNFLKRHTGYQIYNIRLDGRNADKDRDFFSYLSRNPGDFRRAGWAFGLFQVDKTRKDVLPPGLQEKLSHTPVIERLEISYYPDRNHIPGDERRARRRISLRLRRTPFTHTKRELPDIHYTPRYYRFLLPSGYDFTRQQALQATGRGWQAEDQVLVLLDENCPDFQARVGRIANCFQAEISAADRCGLFLLTLPGGARDLQQGRIRLAQEQGLKDDVRLLCAHPFFEREIASGPKNDSNPNLQDWEQRTGINESGSPGQGFPGTLFLFHTARSMRGGAWCGSFRSHDLFPADSLSNQRPLFGQALQEACHDGWPVHYRQAVLYGSSSVQFKEQGKTHILAAGYDILVFLHRMLQSVGSNDMAVAVMDNAGCIPELWPPSGAKANSSLVVLLQRLADKRVYLVAPLPGQGTLPPLTPRRNLFLGLSLQWHSRPLLHNPERVPNPGFKHWFPAPGRDIYCSNDKRFSSGNALAAAALAPPLALALAGIPHGAHYDLAEALLASSELRGELGLARQVVNRGLITPSLLHWVVSNRRFQKQAVLDYRSLKKMSYIHVDNLLYGAFTKGVHEATHIKALPYNAHGRFTRTYQYYDRSRTFSGIAMADALYNLKTPLAVQGKEREELALVAFRGSVFLLCTRNSHRGWILNLESIIPRNGRGMAGPIRFDQDDRLVFFHTGHGELIAADLESGLLQELHLYIDGVPRPSQQGLATDHALGNGYLALDEQHNRLWIYGGGSRYLVRLAYRRTGQQVRLDYDSKLDCNKQPLFPRPINVTRRPAQLFSAPAIFRSGSFNLIIHAANPGYLRFDRKGNRF